MKVHIYGEIELIEALTTGAEDFTHCISIGDPEQTLPDTIRKACTEILRLEFYDVEDENTLLDGRKLTAPGPDDARKVIDFFHRTRKNADGYVVHCRQGISRSTAVGLALLYLLGVPEDELLDRILEIRPQAIPHLNLLRYFDDELGTNLSQIGEIIRHYRILQWKKELEGST